jgi:hypothetical protein
VKVWWRIILIAVLLWLNPLLGQLLSPGKLARPHADLEGLENCTQCHTPGAQLDQAKCLNCHPALTARLEAGKGYHARLRDRRCVECHSDHRGPDYEMIHWQPERFDHDSTGYALEGGHARAKCAQCHKTRSYLGLAAECLGCHADEHRGQLGGDCLTCHTYQAWKPAPFDHRRTRFPLSGKHAQVACAQCHPQGRYRDIPFGTCRDCHADYHQGQFAADCQACHAESGWKPARFDHRQARFPLSGKHARVACARCHPQGRYRPLAFSGCGDCHRDPHRPSLGPACQGCHAAAGWKETRETFDHERTGYPLRGRHAQVACERCHAAGKFRDLSFGTCRDCHADYHQGQLAADCQECHAESGWKPARFDHRQARFPLSGKHAQVACAQCHPQGQYRPLAVECRNCHADYHQGQFAADCQACHAEEGWKPATFTHDRAAFRLDGAHTAVECGLCHPLETNAAGIEYRRFRPLSADCAACHS